MKFDWPVMPRFTSVFFVAFVDWEEDGCLLDENENHLGQGTVHA